MIAHSPQGDSFSRELLKSDRDSKHGTSPSIDNSSKQLLNSLTIQRRAVEEKSPLVILPLKYGAVAFAPAEGVASYKLPTAEELLKLREAEIKGGEHFLDWLRQTLNKLAEVGGEFSGSLGSSSADILRTYCMRSLLDKSREVPGFRCRTWKREGISWREETLASPADLTHNHLVWFDVDISLCSSEIPDGNEVLSLLARALNGKSEAVRFDAKSLAAALTSPSSPEHMLSSDMLSLALASKTLFAKIPVIDVAGEADFALNHFLYFSRPGAVLTIHNGPSTLVDRDFARQALPVGIDEGADYLERLTSRSRDLALGQVDVLQHYAGEWRRSISEINARYPSEIARRRQVITSLLSSIEAFTRYIVAVNELKTQIETLPSEYAVTYPSNEAAQWQKNMQRILDIARKQLSTMEQLVERDEQTIDDQKKARSQKYRDAFRDAALIIGTVLGAGSQLPVHVPKYGLWIYAGITLAAVT